MARKPVLPGWPRAMRADLASAYVGLSVTSIHRLRHAGDFPEPVQLTPGAVVWLIEDLDAWLDRRAGRVKRDDDSELMALLQPRVA